MKNYNFLFSCTIFSLISLIASDVAIIKLEKVYFNYSELYYEYIDDSEGYHLSSLLCSSGNTTYAIEECLGKVVLLNSKDEVAAVFKSYSLDNDENKLKGIIYNNSTRSKFFILSYPIPTFAVDNSTYNIMSNNIGKNVELYYTKIHKTELTNLLLCFVILTSIMGASNLIWIFSLFWYKNYLTKLQPSLSLIFNFRLGLSILAIYYIIITVEKLHISNVHLFHSARVSKLIIEVSDKVYRAFFITYLSSIGSGWQITKNTRIMTEVKSKSLMLIVYLLFYIVDVFITNDFFLFYIMPVKNLMGFLMFYMNIINYAKKTSQSIRFNSNISVYLMTDYMSSLLHKAILLKHFIFVYWLYVYLYFALYSYLNFLTYRQFHTGYLILLDNFILLPFLLVFRPKKIRMFESYYLRRSFVREAVYCEFKLMLKADELKEEDYGVYLSSSENGNYAASEADLLPVVVLNPSVFYKSEVTLDNIMSDISIAVPSNE